MVSFIPSGLLWVFFFNLDNNFLISGSLSYSFTVLGRLVLLLYGCHIFSNKPEEMASIFQSSMLFFELPMSLGSSVWHPCLWLSISLWCVLVHTCSSALWAMLRSTEVGGVSLICCLSVFGLWASPSKGME